MSRLFFTAVLLSASPAVAENKCRTLAVEMTPAELESRHPSSPAEAPDAALQIVMWLEDDQGNFIDTLFITDKVGRYGLGNRPGHRDLNSSWAWPYGRRESTFPVWAQRHGKTYPLVVFQNGDDTNLSHPLSHSSSETLYCRPLLSSEDMWDTESCATIVNTDKGLLSPNSSSKYPPRSDIDIVNSVDDPSLADFASMNTVDSVSRATPPLGENFDFLWVLPSELSDGTYKLFVETSKEFDPNDNYAYPPLEGIPWSQYGVAYRGQPSIIYQVDIVVADGQTNSVSTSTYAGYGDPDGMDGAIRPPDGTITTNVVGSGAGRLMLIDPSPAANDEYRLRVMSQSNDDQQAPEAIAGIDVGDVDQTKIDLSFVEPNDDTGVTGFEVRYLAGDTVTAANWDDAIPAAVNITPAGPGSLQSFELRGLMPQTNYSIGIRATDQCLNLGGLDVVNVATARRQPGTVDMCVVATASYGSLMATDVVALRQFRDEVLRKSLFGEVAVELYYSAGPAIAGPMGYFDSARATGRYVLAPFVAAAKALKDSKQQLRQFLTAK